MKRSNKVILRRVGDICFLQSQDGFEQKMILLNNTGAFLWEAMNDSCEEKHLVEALTIEYDVPKCKAYEDVRAFLAFLANNNCLDSEEKV